MSFNDYRASIELYHRGYSLEALIMAAMHRADYSNMRLLQAIYPEVKNEVLARKQSPDGTLPSDHGVSITEEESA
jgi:hypothetical protein